MNREKIINSYSEYDFVDFLEHDHYGEILELLNDEGLEILEDCPQKEDRIGCILNFSRYKYSLLERDDFLEVLLNSRIRFISSSLSALEPETCERILKKYMELTTDPNSIAELFSYFSTKYKLNKLDNWPYSKEILYSYFNKEENAAIIQKIITNYNIDLSNKKINIESLIRKAESSVLCSQEKRNQEDKIVPTINIPVHMMTKELGKRLWSEYDIFELRKLLNSLEYSTNPEEINNYIKQKESTIIYNYNEQTFNSPYKEIYESVKNMMDAEKNNDDEKWYKARRDFAVAIDKCEINGVGVYETIDEKYKEKNIEAIYNYLKQLSDRELSNYIIDYNFEENFHNIMIDVGELLRFYYDGNITLPEEHVELYNQIINIDYLSIEEKKELHYNLKKYNIKELFYDDMAVARYIVNDAIKEYSLNKETIKQYKDEGLSQKYGLDVYKIDDEPFFGIVKTGRHIPDKLPTGHSYSLVGNDCVTVYGRTTKDSDTFLYDAEDLNPEQIVHVFPFDSYTLYKPFEVVDNPTRTINTLMMPEDITGLSSGSYSEILILEAGTKKTDIDEKIPELKRIALYCMDEITEDNIKVAKEKNLGIILVNSKKYFENREYYKNKYKHIIKNLYEYEYYSGDKYKRDKFEARR